MSRSARIDVRVTPEEHAELRQKAKGYSSLSDYLRQAGLEQAGESPAGYRCPRCEFTSSSKNAKCPTHGRKVQPKEN